MSTLCPGDPGYPVAIKDAGLPPVALTVDQKLRSLARAVLMADVARNPDGSLAQSALDEIAAGYEAATGTHVRAREFPPGSRRIILEPVLRLVTVRSGA